MTTAVVTDRYARAIRDLANESGQLSVVAQHLRRAADAYKSSAELRAVLGDPILDEDKRLSLVAALGQRLALIPIVQNTLNVLVVRGRIDTLPDIARRLIELADEQAGLIQASVSSAAPLTDSDVQVLKAELERLTGCKIALERQHDPSVG